MLNQFVPGLLGRVAGLVLFGVGCWLLWKGFVGPSVFAGVAGGACMMAGMWVMAMTRRLTD